MGGNFKLGPWLVDTGLNTISRNGASIHLAPKAMDVLLCLADHTGETVSKETLLHTVWPDTFVGEEVLKSSISDLRRALEDDAREPSIIRTVPKRGYRLVMAVERLHDVPDAGTASQRMNQTRRFQTAVLVLAGALLVLVAVAQNIGRVRHWLRPEVAPQIHSVAVLPLRNLSSDPNQEYFSDGLTDELITDLAQIGSLKVISHTSTMQYRGSRKTLPEIARELNVDGIIEGTVQRSGDRVQITVQLIHGPTDKHLWASSYEREMRDIFALERDVSEQISQQVQARVLVQRRETQLRPRSVNPKALDAYLQGYYHMQHVAHGSIDQELKEAADYFRQAIDIDPNFAPAYVGLSDAVGSHMRNTVEDAIASRKAAEKAAELDPTSSAALTTLAGFKLFYSWDWAGAEELFRRAVLFNPNSADSHEGLSQILYATGRIDEGWHESQIAQELDPNQDHLSEGLVFRRDYDHAIGFLLKRVERSPDDGDAYECLSHAYSLKGMQKEAIRALHSSVTLHGFPESARRVEQAFLASGYDAALRVFAEELEQLSDTKQAFLPASTASIFALVGDKDRAFHWLDEAFQNRGMIGRETGLVFVKVDPSLDSLRSDPRYADLLRRIGLPP